MNDITTPEDIRLLVDSFYTRVLKDELIGHIFTEVVPISWQKHMPVMYSFWNSVIFGAAAYKGNPMTVHMALNAHFPLTQAHFDRWLQLWSATVNDLFCGPHAAAAIEKAASIATIMLHKINARGLI